MAVAAVVGACALLGPGALPPPAGAVATAATSVTCPGVVAPLTPAQSDQVWSTASRRLSALTGPASLPFGATGRSRYVRTNAYAWTSGFFPSSLWLMYARTKDRVWLDRARRYTARVLPVATWTGTHDLGFMVGLPARLGMGLDPSSARQEAYARAILTAARSLSTRWSDQVRALRSGTYGGKWGVIIDSAMNASLLIDAALILGGAEGRELTSRGTEHLLTLARVFVRPDGSTVHRMAFDPVSGKAIGPVPGQGLSTASTWARGQAWAVNGFARGYRLTRNEQLLDAARRTADFWIARVPSGCIPAWDLDIADSAAPRDSSAAAIMADGLLGLAEVDPDRTRATAYRDYANATLGTLASAPWVPTGPGTRGLLQRQAYSIPGDRREGTYVWGDTYLLGALSTIG